jgi:hypothetical protein
MAERLYGLSNSKNTKTFEGTQSAELDPLRELLISWDGQRGNSIALSYGSSVEGSETSDLDMLVVTDKLPGDETKNRFIDGLKQLHKETGRSIDEEVPYDNKIFYTYDELEEALRLPFAQPTDPGSIDIRYLDQAHDDDPYFESLEMKQRLIFNALTSPNELLTGDQAIFVNATILARDSLSKLVAHLKSGDDRPAKKILAESKDGVSGKDYLGYFDIPRIA